MNSPFYRVVGWFSFNPLDTSTPPFSLECQVETNSRRHAFDAGERALRLAQAPGAQLLNWYVEPKTETE